MLSSLWRLAEKAGRSGWEGIIPIYNLYTLSKIIGKRGWWMFLFFIPVVSSIAWVVSCFLLAQKFGRGVGTGLGLWLLAPIFLPILAFGESEYEGNDDDFHGYGNDQDRYVPRYEKEEEDIMDAAFGNDGRFFVNEDGDTVEEIPLDEWE